MWIVKTFPTVKSRSELQERMTTGWIGIMMAGAVNPRKTVAKEII
jgi:hypothetical protein